MASPESGSLALPVNAIGTPVPFQRKTVAPVAMLTTGGWLTTMVTLLDSMCPPSASLVSNWRTWLPGDTENVPAKFEEFAVPEDVPSTSSTMLTMPTSLLTPVPKTCTGTLAPAVV